MNPDPDPPRAKAPRRRPTAAAARGAGPACEIALQNPCGYPDLERRRLRPWLGALVGELAPGARSLAVRFVSDREMRRINRDFRGQDKATDVLSFPADLETGKEPGREASGDGERHLGDLVIAVPTARRQAAAAGHGVHRELRTLLLHGVLHCLGHDHESDDGTMDRLEARLRRRWLEA